MSFFVTADGGLTTAGYVGCVVLMVALVVIASVLSAQKSKGTGMDARKLAFCAMGMALAFVTSYVKVFELPYGGSVTLFSMLFIVLIANWYGAKTGILVGFAYGLLQFIQGPYVQIQEAHCLFHNHVPLPDRSARSGNALSYLPVYSFLP